MFSSRKILWICALTVFSGIVNADVIIDNQGIPGSEISSITIGPTSGDMFITTIPGYTVTKVVVGANVAITSFFANPATITAGGSTTISWATQNADSCSASNGFGNWSGAVSANGGSMSVSTATPGNYTFTLTCQGTGGPAVATTDVAVNAAGNVAITSLSASPSSIIQGSTSTIIWTTQNADSCSASGGFGTWSGSVPVSGSRNVSTSAVGSYTFTLTCQGAGGPVSDTTNVTVTESAPGCDAPPLGGNEVSWQAFWGEAFPGPKTLLRETQIPFSGWIAVKFNTGSVIGTGGISSIESTRTSGSRFGAISQCPGDFNAPADCQYQWGIGGGIGWTTEGYSGACDLLPDTDYYLNVTFTDGFDPDSSTCDAIPCITKLRYYEF